MGKLEIIMGTMFYLSPVNNPVFDMKLSSLSSNNAYSNSLILICKFTLRSIVIIERLNGASGGSVIVLGTSRRGQVRVMTRQLCYL